MSDKTGIQWTDATWNPIRGCSRVSEGCRNCYAESVAARFSGPGMPYEGLARRTSNGAPRWTGKIMFVEKVLNQPLSWRRPRKIFVNSMSDLFHEGVSDEQLDRIFAVMALADRHTFQVLTKRPQRMRRYLSAPGLRERIAAAANTIMRAGTTTRGFDHALAHRFLWRSCDEIDPGPWANRLSGITDDHWPLPNVWLGVSVEDQKVANERIPLLLDAPAVIHFLSCEPLLGPVDLNARLWMDVHGGIDWVIVGGESGGNARPCDVTWIQRIVADCTEAGVAVFVKQLGAYPVNGEYPIALQHGHGGDPLEWAPHLRIRNFPEIAA